MQIFVNLLFCLNVLLYLISESEICCQPVQKLMLQQSLFWFAFFVKLIGILLDLEIQQYLTISQTKLTRSAVDFIDLTNSIS